MQHDIFITFNRLSLTLALLLAIAPSYAADHFVSHTTSTVDCATLGGGVKPGDTITLAAGNRGPLRVRNCEGTTAEPITVRNDPSGPGPTVIRRSSAGSGGFIFDCTTCVNVVIDGTGKWNGIPEGAYCGAPSGRTGCGIKITSIAANDSPSSYLRLSGLTTNVTVRGVEVDGRMSDLNTTGIGIQQNDQSILAADHPGFWREGMVYESNYIHDVLGEGTYIGPNWVEPDLRVPLRNITIRNNLVENTGRENIQMKSAIEGVNKIYNNVVRRSGLRNEGQRQGAGISITEGGNVRVHNNWVEASGVQGIQHYNGGIPSSMGTFTSEIFNNVVYDSGKLGGADGNGHGITVSSKDGSASIRVSIVNNTVVETATVGINTGSRVTGGLVQNNIVAAWGVSALSVAGNTNTNNSAGTISSMKFVDAAMLNFALAEDSPARDSGSSSDFPPYDFVGVPRPQGGGPDQGAFEFSVSQPAPVAPATLVVE